MVLKESKDVFSKLLMRKNSPHCMNIQVSEKILSQLVHLHGGTSFCICPGGRNAPLVAVVSRAKGLQTFSFFDERSAGFFALGLAKREGIPSAVITTSGTAVAELLPSVIEAYYSHIPLILITADRPSSYRGTGAPQSIEQTALFGPYVGRKWDLENTLDFDLSDGVGQVPCHINVCFDTPLLDGPVCPLDFRDQKKTSWFLDSAVTKADGGRGYALWGPEGSGAFDGKMERERIKSFFKKCQKPLFILTEMSEQVSQEVEDILYSHFQNGVTFAEALSHLRESKKLFLLKSGEGILKYLALNKKIDGVVRVGRRPVARFWKDLEKSYAHLPVLSVSDQTYPGLSRIEPAISFKTFFKWSKQNKAPKGFSIKEQAEIADEDKRQRAKFIQNLNKNPLGELALIRDFSKKIPKGSLLFLGNSLPIREWNQVADLPLDTKIKYRVNRGANGIDGLLSTFLGALELGRQNWCLIGDLSALYDMSALWAFHQLKEKPACFIVVVNNGGGRIFSSLFADPVFINAHSLSFQHWAKMWDFHYYRLKQWPDKLSFVSPAIIELIPASRRSRKYTDLV